MGHPHQISDFAPPYQGQRRFGLADPKRVFDKEARRALRKWKYKPKIENGVPVAQHDMFVVLDFRFESAR